LGQVKGSVKALKFWANVISLKFEKTMLICQLAPYWTEGRTRHPDIMSYRTAGPPMGKTAPVLMGATVQPKDGEVAARIDDLVIDSKDGRVVFLVLDGVPGRGDSQVAVPFGELSLSGNAFVLNTTEEQLASAPSFNGHADMNNRRYAEDVYKYFGQQPYWTIGGQMESSPMGQPMIEEKSDDEYMEP
jgi:hypothetical protein